MMPIGLENVRILVVKLANHDERHWRAVLTPEEVQRTNRFLMVADQRRFAITRGVLRTLLSQYVDLRPAEVEFVANAYGKPELAANQNQQRVSFNVSHSGDYALLGFARDMRIGVDVEWMAGQRVIRDLAPAVLSPGELALFEALPESEQRRLFFQIWTLKEAVLKAVGSGLSVAPEKIEVAFSPREPALLSSLATEVSDVVDWSIRSLDLGDKNYAAAVAVEARHFELTIDEFRQK